MKSVCRTQFLVQRNTSDLCYNPAVGSNNIVRVDSWTSAAMESVTQSHNLVDVILWNIRCLPIGSRALTNNSIMTTPIVP